MTTLSKATAFLIVLLTSSLSIATDAVTEVDVPKADAIARQTASWFTYTTGPITTDHQGQCGDYAVMFILKYNAAVGKNVARLVTTNNPIPSGTYRLGDKVDISQFGFPGWKSGASGFVPWKGQQYIFHPVLGAYPIYLEKSWSPKTHFGVDMLDKKQVHTWASVANLSVDPTYFATHPSRFSSPLGSDQ